MKGGTTVYARTYNDDNEKQSFRIGEYNIPANYCGNAFTKDEIPDIDKCEACEADASDITEGHFEKESVQKSHCEKKEICDRQNECPYKNRGNGLFGGILSRLGRDIEIDDIILIGLIALLLFEKKDGCDGNTDEIIILLALLLFGGF